MLLKVKQGERFRDLLELKVGVPLVVGRLPECQVSFPDDAEISGRHLTLEFCEDGLCVFKDLGSTNGSFLDELPVNEGLLKPGNVLRCGLTLLCVEPVHRHAHSHSAPVQAAILPQRNSAGDESGGAKSTQPSVGGHENPGMTEMKGFVAGNALHICEKYSLGDSLKVVAKDTESPADYAIRLSQSCKENECLQFLSFALPKRMATWWLVQCIRAANSFKSEADLPMLAVVEAWVRNPAEETRRKAMKLAEQLQMASPAAWSGVSAFWAHGSMGPAEAPAVPAADNLSGKAVFGGIVLAAVLHSPEKAPERRRQFTHLALEISEGKRPWN